MYFLICLGALNIPSLALTKAEGSKFLLDRPNFSDEEELSLGLLESFWRWLSPLLVPLERTNNGHQN